MNRTLRRLACASLVLALPSLSFALDPNDILRAEKILRTVVDLTAKYQFPAGNLAAPEPLTDKSGKYFAPFKADGSLTEWATKALSAQIGSAAGEKAGGMLASKVPFAGGLLSGAAKKKGKKMGAVAAIGGMDYIKESSELSFNSLEDMAVYMHVKNSGGAGYSQALATAIAVYPELEKSYDSSVKKAFELFSAAAKAGT